MQPIFLSHSEVDKEIAIELAELLELHGFSTWYYERDGIPGQSYLIQVGRAIQACSAIILLASRASMASDQVTAEIVRGYEARKPFIPVLYGISHREIQEGHDVWSQALVIYTSIAVPPDGFGAILNKIVEGLQALGIQPHGAAHIAPTLRIGSGSAGATNGREGAQTRTVRYFGVFTLAVVIMIGYLFFRNRIENLPTVRPHPTPEAQPVEPSSSQPHLVKPTTSPPPQRSNSPRRVPKSTTPEPLPTSLAGGAVSTGTGERSGGPVPDRHPLRSRFLVLIDDPGGAAVQRLNAKLVGRGYTVIDAERACAAAASETGMSSLRGSDQACTSLASRFSAEVVIAAKFSEAQAPSAYGLVSIRATVFLRLVSQDGRSLGSWSLESIKVGATLRQASDSALSSIVDQIVDKIASAVPVG